MALRLLSSNTLSRILPEVFVQSNALSFATSLPPAKSIFFPALLQPAAFTSNVPDILSNLWESVLRAVPKKKTSHMKKRHRQMAGKALKDVKNLNTCAACGQIKRSHVLCQHCVENIKKQWGNTPLA